METKSGSPYSLTTFDGGLKLHVFCHVDVMTLRATITHNFLSRLAAAVRPFSRSRPSLSVSDPDSASLFRRAVSPEARPALTHSSSSGRPSKFAFSPPPKNELIACATDTETGVEGPVCHVTSL